MADALADRPDAAPCWTTIDPATLDRHRAELDRSGYTIVRLLEADDPWLTAVRARIDELMRQEGAATGSEFSQEAGTGRLSDLVNKGEVFDRTWRDGWMHALVAHVLREPFKFSSLNFREALPGHGAQDLHADLAEPGHGGVSTVWALDPFTRDNGATRVVPGSHRVPLSRLTGDRGAPHPDEIVITCPAGHVVVYDVHLWHSGTRNLSGARRRALHAFFCPRWQPQQIDQRRFLRPETRARLPARDLHLLGVG